MRNILSSVAILSSLLLFSCKKSADFKTEENAEGIVSQLSTLSVDARATESGQLKNGPARQASFKLLSFAIARAGLANDLNDPKLEYTLFAPTDEAFTAAGLGTQQAINGVPKEQLADILLYHVYGSKVLAAQVPTTYTELTMLNMDKAYVIRKGMDVYINGTPVVAADIPSKSGVIHAIDRVLMPPAGTIVDIAVSNPDLSYLVAAVQRAGLVSALSGAGPITVFAPTNQAFIAAGFPTIASIQAASPAALTPILTYHVTSGRIFSSDLVNGQMLTMLSGGTTTILLGSAGAQIDGTGSVPSNIIRTDLVATNGVVHVIDRVLLP